MSMLTLANHPATSATGTISVVHVVYSLEVGGLENVVLDLVRQGPALGQRVTVVSLTGKGALSETAAAAGARVIHLCKPPGIRLSLVGRLRKIFEEIKPDVVHCHQIGGLFYAGPAARKYGVRAVVYTEHGKHYANRFRTRVLGRHAGRYTDRFFCVSEDLAGEVRQCKIAPEAKIAVMTNGIDLERFRLPPDEALREQLGIPAGAAVVGTIGRLAEVKRQDVLLRGFALVHKSIPDAHLMIVGDGPMRGELTALAENLGIAQRTHFAGYQPRPQRYLSLMNVFAITSRSEGMPLAVLEAWASSKPVVASAVGGLPEMIDDGRTGMLFPSGNDGALAAALTGLLENPLRAKSMGEAGLAEVSRRYSLERMAADYHREYLTLLRRN